MILPAIRGTGAIGLRLPIAADDVQIDRGWPGWAVDDPNDGEERVARLTRAVAEGAVTWRIIDERTHMIQMLDRPGTRAPQVAADLWMSERTLRRTCRAWFATSPGALAQVLRLWRFAHAAQRLPLAGAADEAGYADRSHANRDIRAITGLRGGELAAWSAFACGLDLPTLPCDRRRCFVTEAVPRPPSPEATIGSPLPRKPAS